MKVKSTTADVTYEMTEDQIEAAYRYQEFKYRVEDAKGHIYDMFNSCDCNDEAFKEEYGVTYSEILDCAEDVAEQFLDDYDCNIPENDEFDFIIWDNMRQLREAKEAVDVKQMEKRAAFRDSRSTSKTYERKEN